MCKNTDVNQEHLNKNASDKKTIFPTYLSRIPKSPRFETRTKTLSVGTYKFCPLDEEFTKLYNFVCAVGFTWPLPPEDCPQPTMPRTTKTRTTAMDKPGSNTDPVQQSLFRHHLRARHFHGHGRTSMTPALSSSRSALQSSTRRTTLRMLPSSESPVWSSPWLADLSSARWTLRPSSPLMSLWSSSQLTFRSSSRRSVTRTSSRRATPRGDPRGVPKLFHLRSLPRVEYSNSSGRLEGFGAEEKLLLYRLLLLLARGVHMENMKDFFEGGENFWSLPGLINFWLHFTL